MWHRRLTCWLYGRLVCKVFCVCLVMCIDFSLFYLFQPMKTRLTKEEECPKRNSVRRTLLIGGCGSASKARSVLQQVFVTVVECCCEQTAVCISIRKNKCNNILSYAVCLLPFLRWRPRVAAWGGRHSLSCTRYLRLTTAPSFPEAAPKTPRLYR